ncbi:hypothetical protein [Clostridium lacusfryxellense]|uniref:hypothetical protein n=1 Tax=Clostridium lacusfryxellense TaxID=205328 RepID=UPI001C0ADAD6|nr:hypothetical protein [Clostridium lacusfryxellense]MBU3110302.1 hypothetical protein [Clostridium lacusfryxellense]
MTKKALQVVNTVTGSTWLFDGLRNAEEELHITSRYISDFCTGKRDFYNNKYVFSFIAKETERGN